MYNCIDGVEIRENDELTVLQLVFSANPSAAVRSILKSNGFIWSRKNTAWQRQLTTNARIATTQVLEQLSILDTLYDEELCYDERNV